MPRPKLPTDNPYSSDRTPRFKGGLDIVTRTPRHFLEKILFVRDWVEPPGFCDWSVKEREKFRLELNRKGREKPRAPRGKRHDLGIYDPQAWPNRVLFPRQLQIYDSWVWFGAYDKINGRPVPVNSRGRVPRQLWTWLLGHLHEEARLRMIMLPSAEGPRRLGEWSDVNPYKYLPGLGDRNDGGHTKREYLMMLGLYMKPMFEKFDGYSSGHGMADEAHPLLEDVKVERGQDPIRAAMEALFRNTDEHGEDIGFDVDTMRQLGEKMVVETMQMVGIKDAIRVRALFKEMTK